jgi:hypothetical protein
VITFPEFPKESYDATHGGNLNVDWSFAPDNAIAWLYANSQGYWLLDVQPEQIDVTTYCDFVLGRGKQTVSGITPARFADAPTFGWGRCSGQTSLTLRPPRENP